MLALAIIFLAISVILLGIASTKTNKRITHIELTALNPTDPFPFRNNLILAIRDPSDLDDSDGSFWYNQTAKKMWVRGKTWEEI